MAEGKEFLRMNAVESDCPQNCMLPQISRRLFAFASKHTVASCKRRLAKLLREYVDEIEGCDLILFVHGREVGDDERLCDIVREKSVHGTVNVFYQWRHLEPGRVRVIVHPMHSCGVEDGGMDPLTVCFLSLDANDSVQDVCERLSLLYEEEHERFVRSSRIDLFLGVWVECKSIPIGCLVHDMGVSNQDFVDVGYQNMPRNSIRCFLSPNEAPKSRGKQLKPIRNNLAYMHRRDDLFDLRSVVSRQYKKDYGVKIPVDLVELVVHSHIFKEDAEVGQLLLPSLDALMHEAHPQANSV